MSAAHVRREPDADAAALTAATLVASAVAEALTERGTAHVALSGGSTPVRCYELLGTLVTDWRMVQLWFCDERCVEPDHADSNFRLASAALQAPRATWHRIAGEAGPHAATADYERQLTGVTLDAALLGLGEDGHTASLFPRHPALHASGRAVAVTDAPKPPPERVSLSLGTLNQARHLVLLVTANAKAPALAAALSAPSPDAPASLLSRDHLTVVTTVDALTTCPPS